MKSFCYSPVLYGRKTMDLLEVGKIVNTHGLRGEVKIVPWTDTPDVFEDLDYVIIKRSEERR